MLFHTLMSQCFDIELAWTIETASNISLNAHQILALQAMPKYRKCHNVKLLAKLARLKYTSTLHFIGVYIEILTTRIPMMNDIDTSTRLSSSFRSPLVCETDVIIYETRVDGFLIVTCWSSRHSKMSYPSALLQQGGEKGPDRLSKSAGLEIRSENILLSICKFIPPFSLLCFNSDIYNRHSRRLLLRGFPMEGSQGSFHRTYW